MSIGESGEITDSDGSIWWVISSVWCRMTYHALLQCVSMLSAILPPPSAITTTDDGGKMAE